MIASLVLKEVKICQSKGARQKSIKKITPTQSKIFDLLIPESLGDFDLEEFADVIIYRSPEILMRVLDKKKETMITAKINSKNVTVTKVAP